MVNDDYAHHPTEDSGPHLNAELIAGLADRRVVPCISNPTFVFQNSDFV